LLAPRRTPVPHYKDLYVQREGFSVSLLILGAAAVGHGALLYFQIRAMSAVCDIVPPVVMFHGAVGQLPIHI